MIALCELAERFSYYGTTVVFVSFHSYTTRTRTRSDRGQERWRSRSAGKQTPLRVSTCSSARCQFDFLAGLRPVRVSSQCAHPTASATRSRHLWPSIGRAVDQSKFVADKSDCSCRPTSSSSLCRQARRRAPTLSRRALSALVSAHLLVSVLSTRSGTLAHRTSLHHRVSYARTF